MRILFSGGGTAGHIFPLVSIVREIKNKYPDSGFEFFYLGPKDKFSKEILSREGITVKTVLAGKLRRYFSLFNLIDFLKFPIGLFQAFYQLFVISPDLIFSKGGYGSLPVVLCGRIFGTPIFLQESDVTPGLVNRIASRFALEIFVAFSVRETEYFPAEKMISVGNPVRKEILSGRAEEAKKTFKLTGEKPLIFILGGSQGAQRINDAVLSILAEILRDFEIIHQTGRKNFEEVKKEADFVIAEDLKKYYHPRPFLDEQEMANAFAAADLILSRAGAGAIFEIAAAGKPSILAPLPESAQNHQIKNAYAYAKYGTALVVEEPNFRAHFILERIKFLFSQPEKLKEMSRRAKEFSCPDAARITAEYLVAYLNQ